MFCFTTTLMTTGALLTLLLGLALLRLLLQAASPSSLGRH